VDFAESVVILGGSTVSTQAARLQQGSVSLGAEDPAESAVILGGSTVSTQVARLCQRKMRLSTFLWILFE